MSVELGKFVSEQLDVLPENHQDRPFIEGLSKMVDKYVANPDAAINFRASLAEAAIKKLGIPNKYSHPLYLSFVHGRTSSMNPSHLTDDELLNINQIGPKKLRLIRERFPFVQEVSTSQFDILQVNMENGRNYGASEIVDLPVTQAVIEKKADFLDKLTDKIINRKVARVLFIASVIGSGATGANALYLANQDYHGTSGNIEGTNIIIDQKSYADVLALGEAGITGTILLTGVGFSLVINKLANNSSKNSKKRDK